MTANTILLYSRSRGGKTTLTAELAEHVFQTTGKKTRVYTADRGGTGPMTPHIALGIIDIVEQGTTDPWVFLNKSCKGEVRDANGKWVPGISDDIGMYAFESMTAFADALMLSLATKAAAGVNIGGSANISFTVQDTDGESVKVGGANMAHYNVVQTRITEEVWASQRLPAQYVLWTASVSKDDDTTSTNKVLGPQVVGKALTAEVPRWFNLTFRIDAVPAKGGQGEKHILYLGNSMDVNSGNAVSVGNTRIPLDAKELPTTIEPASLVKAITLIDNAHKEAMEAVRKRIGAK